ncbi:hypothetical protein L9W92_00650 [Pelotomaculum terephthalicicum JT]|uniref:hypothetical protein n=1 Tax=Pelotomaculum terephthalicicum TaxID=206393 RepID=UPI0009C45E31|nr:hypothetical protein [Pelotomaculum terephthalicicum]MCG9966566.1 hypothetical protein [Pelotomaculum terephthalicicum JT]OPY63504.1 MAG: hypothetical protein A4E56_00497 [Pelotomaculum sp. PtaU1.Bin065]
MANRRKSQQFEVVVVYDENGPTFDELLHSPEVMALFEGLLITKKLLKPEFRSKQPKQVFSKSGLYDIIDVNNEL